MAIPVPSPTRICEKTAPTLHSRPRCKRTTAAQAQTEPRHRHQSKRPRLRHFDAIKSAAVTWSRRKLLLDVIRRGARSLRRKSSSKVPLNLHPRVRRHHDRVADSQFVGNASEFGVERRLCGLSCHGRCSEEGGHYDREHADYCRQTGGMHMTMRTHLLARISTLDGLSRSLAKT